MAIPAIRRSPTFQRPGKVTSPPVSSRWGHTYVSIRGSNGEGEEIPLTGFSSSSWPAIFLQPGATGLDAPPVELHSEDSPNLDGGMYRNSRFVQREIMLPVYLYGIDRRTLRDLKRRLAIALNPKKGYCLLKVVESEGPARYLRCYYKNGMEGSEAEDQAGFRWTKYGLQFTAFDPFWYSDEVVVASWNFGDSAATFLPADAPLLPLKILSGGLASGTITVENPGEVEVWPKWQLTGPVSAFTFTAPAGASFGITGRTPYAVPDGRTLTIDTRPGFKTLRDDLNTNYWPFLDTNPQLWSIEPGEISIAVNVEAVAGTQATLQLVLEPRYLTY